MRAHSKVALVMAAVLIMSILLSACQSTPAASPSAGKPEEKAKAAGAKPAEQAKAPATGATKEPYKLGMSLELSGPVASSGVGPAVRDAALLEVEKINAAGGVDGHPIELVVEDNAADPTKASTSLTKLAREDKVLAILGPTYGGIAGAGMAVAEREQVPTILGGALYPEMLAQNPKWTFGGPQVDWNTIGDGIIDVIKYKGYKKVAAVGEDVPGLADVLARVKAKAPSEGIQVVAVPTSFGESDVDMTPQVSALKEVVAKEKPDAVVLSTWAGPAIPFLKGMKQLGVNLPVIGTTLFGMDFLLQMSGDDANGVLFPGLKLLDPEALPDSDPVKRVILDFQNRHKQKYGKLAATYSAGGADMVNVVVNALKVSGPDRAKLRDAIANTSGFIGVDGPLDYKSGAGQLKESLAVFEVKDRKFVYVASFK